MSRAVSVLHPKPMLTQLLEMQELEHEKMMDHQRFLIAAPASLVLLPGERASSNPSCIIT